MSSNTDQITPTSRRCVHQTDPNPARMLDGVQRSVPPANMRRDPVANDGDTHTRDNITNPLSTDTTRSRGPPVTTVQGSSMTRPSSVARRTVTSTSPCSSGTTSSSGAIVLSSAQNNTSQRHVSAETLPQATNAEGHASQQTSRLETRSTRGKPSKKKARARSKATPNGAKRPRLNAEEKRALRSPRAKKYLEKLESIWGDNHADWPLYEVTPLHNSKDCVDLPPGERGRLRYRPVDLKEDDLMVTVRFAEVTRDMESQAIKMLVQQAMRLRLKRELKRTDGYLIRDLKKVLQNPRKLPPRPGRSPAGPARQSAMHQQRSHSSATERPSSPEVIDVETYFQDRPSTPLSSNFDGHLPSGNADTSKDPEQSRNIRLPGHVLPMLIDFVNLAEPSDQTMGRDNESVSPPEFWRQLINSMEAVKPLVEQYEKEKAEALEKINRAFYKKLGKIDAA